MKRKSSQVQELLLPGCNMHTCTTIHMATVAAIKLFEKAVGKSHDLI